MTNPTAPAAEELTWEDVCAAIGREVWKLAPQDHQDSGHRDIKFLTNWQDIMQAVQNGIEAAAALPDEDEQQSDSDPED
ncbi:hypothetical protein [Verrucosispora sp. NA02020]|uniref:hypothetical protein n=1 Tax=Verrucosispora sp. NA02020 TaxID=2742132 RepID=UPI0015912426|nr:hypothetical protein [Verrucosispora sp. NA02020]QKW15474.1 hypothetical protein HUT12_23685 [Verrucosispora sp. NA02020]